MVWLSGEEPQTNSYRRRVLRTIAGHVKHGRRFVQNQYSPAAVLGTGFHRAVDGLAASIDHAARRRLQPALNPRGLKRKRVIPFRPPMDLSSLSSDNTALRGNAGSPLPRAILAFARDVLCIEAFLIMPRVVQFRSESRPKGAGPIFSTRLVIARARRSLRR
jgi:hypothetical protein